MAAGGKWWEAVVCCCLFVKLLMNSNKGLQCQHLLQTDTRTGGSQASEVQQVVRLGSVLAVRTVKECSPLFHGISS